MILARTTCPKASPAISASPWATTRTWTFCPVWRCRGPENSGPPQLDEARRLGARFVLEGGVRLRADDIRVTVRLHDVSGASQTCGETYNRELTAPHLFGVLEEIARSLVAHVGDHYGGAISRTLSPEAVERPTESLVGARHISHVEDVDVQGEVGDVLAFELLQDLVYHRLKPSRWISCMW